LRSRILSCLVVLVLAPNFAAAQNAGDTATLNAVYLELLGNGGLYSVNYDRKVGDQLSLRAGVARWTSIELFGGSSTFTTVPLLTNLLIGRGSHRLEVGAGVMIGSERIQEAQRTSLLNLTSTIGYRFQPLTRGAFLRISLVPEYSLRGDYPEDGFFIFPALSVGFAF
jgi:hypothetical protein